MRSRRRAAAVYTAKQLEGVPPELRERYFEPADERFAFRGDLRRTVIFGRNNLLQDAPISRLDLLLCRNTLMYFTAETQAHDAPPLPLRARARRRADARQVGDDALPSRRVRAGRPHRSASSARRSRRRRCRRAWPGSRTASPSSCRSPTDERLSRDAALEVGPQAQLIVSRDGHADVRQPDRPARCSASRSTQLGRPFQDLDALLPAGRAARAGRRGAARAAPGRGRSRRVHAGANGEERRLDVTVDAAALERRHSRRSA